MVWVIALEKGFVGGTRVKKGARFNYPLKPGKKLPAWVTPAPSNAAAAVVFEEPNQRTLAPASGELVREQTLFPEGEAPAKENADPVENAGVAATPALEAESAPNGPVGDEDDSIV